MKTKNPKIVTDNIIDSEAKNEDTNINVYPVSIFRYAWMERLDSPFIDNNAVFGVDTVIPTAFVFCHTPEELRKYSSYDVEKLKNDAYDWADENLNLSDIPEIIKSITEQLVKLNKASPAVSEDNT